MGRTLRIALAQVAVGSEREGNIQKMLEACTKVASEEPTKDERRGS